MPLASDWSVVGIYPCFLQVAYDDGEWEMVALPDVSVRMLATRGGANAALNGRTIKRRARSEFVSESNATSSEAEEHGLYGDRR
eukprot:628894-Pyramimonas_sp.AAC.1